MAFLRSWGEHPSHTHLEVLLGYKSQAVMAHEGKVDDEVQEREETMQPQELTPAGGWGWGWNTRLTGLQASGAPQCRYTPITPSVSPDIPPTTTASPTRSHYNKTFNGRDPGWG